VATEQRLLGGRYQLGEVLGYGGMAEVFRGRDIRLGRDVAVKVLRADLARDPSFINRFRREAQAAASLNHPAVVSVYDTGEEDATPYIVMEFVDGRTLRDVIRQDGRLMPRRALEIVAAVCAALEYSHRAGIVHRDIKPGNVMLTPTGDVKVMDFGIARALAATAATATQTAAVMGTAQYLSPEQARGELVDARSDVYSTGVLLYELLTGAPPFQGDSPVAVAYQHVREEPVPPSDVDPDLPASLDAVVMKSLAKNPANRYQSAGEFRADLERALAGQRVEATPLLRDDRTVVLGAAGGAAAATSVLAPVGDERRRRGRGWVYALLALLVILVFVAAAYITRSLFSGGSSTATVPSLVGKTLPQAEALLTRAHLRLGSENTYAEGTHNDTLAQGLIFAQSPFPQAAVNKNTAVNVDISGGTETTSVPNVVNENITNAEAALTAAHLNYTVTMVTQPKAGSGTVVAQNPTGGTVHVGTPVALTVANGKVQLPNLAGELLSSAENYLVSQGLQYTVSYTDQPGAQPDTVVSTSPTGGTQVPVNSSVVLVAQQLPPSPSPTPTPTPTPTPPASTPPPSTKSPTQSPPASKTGRVAPPAPPGPGGNPPPGPGT
jgi:beta-lactam-binding protein with PASTA domain/tRNA A-37 threonylcarbamoyl transferase component Bud32